MKRTRITVRVVPGLFRHAANGGRGDGPLSHAPERVPAPPKGAPCDVAPMAQIKPGERIVAEAMREKFDPTTVPEDKELSALKGKVMQMSLDLAALRATVMHILEK